MEDNLIQVAQHIFSGEPALPGTIEFGLEDCAPPNASDSEKTRILFEILMVLFLEGMKIRFGETARPEALLPAQINFLAQYVLSYGFSTHIKTDDLCTPPPPHPAGGTDGTVLKDYHERFYNIEDQKWHEISFDWANIIRPPLRGV